MSDHLRGIGQAAGIEQRVVLAINAGWGCTEALALRRAVELRPDTWDLGGPDRADRVRHWRHCETSTSTWRSLETICSGLYLFREWTSPLRVEGCDQNIMLPHAW